MPKLGSVLGGRGRRSAAPAGKRVAWAEDLARLGAWGEQQSPPSDGACGSVASEAERPSGEAEQSYADPYYLPPDEQSPSGSERQAVGIAGAERPLDVCSAPPSKRPKPSIYCTRPARRSVPSIGGYQRCATPLPEPSLPVDVAPTSCQDDDSNSEVEDKQLLLRVQNGPRRPAVPTAYGHGRRASLAAPLRQEVAAGGANPACQDEGRQAGNAGTDESRPGASSDAAPDVPPQLACVPSLWSALGGVHPTRQRERKRAGTKPTRIPEASALKKLRNPKPPSLGRVTRLAEREKQEALRASADERPASTDLEGPDTPCDSGEALARAAKRQPASHPAARAPAARHKRVLRLWPDRVQRRRTSLAVREVPVSAGFHIRNLSRADFEAASQPHPQAFALGAWEPFEPPDEGAAAAQQGVGSELVLVPAAVRGGALVPVAAAAAEAPTAASAPTTGAGGSGDVIMLDG